MTSEAYFRQQLNSLNNQGLYRELKSLNGRSAAEPTTVLNFSSNDYLGLARDPRLKSAAAAAVYEYGAGSTASRLLAGHSEHFEQLESDLAGMTGTESALVFGSGFLTNLGVLSSVAEDGDEVFSDELNHASIIDGIRLGRARCSVFKHKDLNHLEALVKKSRLRGKRIIVSDSVFSMDGDLAPVEALCEIAMRHGAWLVIDEAHALGVLGKNGGGLCRIDGHEVHPDIVVGTLSKALGSYGGFVGCSDDARQFLINKARTFIYSTALPPPCIGSAREAIAIVSSQPEMAARLLDNARTFHSILSASGLHMPPFESQIVPVLVGANQKAVDFSARLNERGLAVRAIRPPTVPPGTARVRLSITLQLSGKQLEGAALAITEAAKEVGLVE